MTKLNTTGFGRPKYPKCVAAALAGDDATWKLAWALRDEVKMPVGGGGVNTGITAILAEVREEIIAHTGIDYAISTLSSYRVVGTNFSKKDIERYRGVGVRMSVRLCESVGTPEKLAEVLKVWKAKGKKPRELTSWTTRDIMAAWGAAAEREHQRALNAQRKAHEDAKRRRTEAEERKRTAKSDADRKRAEADVEKAKADIVETKVPPKRDDTAIAPNLVPLVLVESNITVAILDSIKAAQFATDSIKPLLGDLDGEAFASFAHDAKRAVAAWQAFVDICEKKSASPKLKLVK